VRTRHVVLDALGSTGKRWRRHPPSNDPEVNDPVSDTDLDEASVRREVHVAVETVPAIRVPHGAVVTPLDDVAIAVRLRRAWTDELAPWLLGLDHDLGHGWQATAVQRSGLSMDLLTPFDFGIGTPLEGIADEFAARLVAATDGRIDRVRVTFRGSTKTKTRRRGATSDTNVFDPGDPEPEACAAAATALGRRMPSELSVQATAVISRLSVAGVSQHRVWLAAPSAEAATAVGSTPGAAYALREAVRKWQQKDPLYAAYVDSTLAGSSPSLTM